MRAAIAIVLIISALASPALAQDGTITGVVLSGSSQAVPDAIVSLTDEDGNYVFVPDNPQFSSNGTGNNVGVYTFTEVPPGNYNVTAAKGDSQFFALVTVDGGTGTANVVLSDYYVTERDFPNETVPGAPEEKVYYTFVPATFGKAPPQTGSQSYFAGLMLTGSGAIGLLALGLRFART